MYDIILKNGNVIENVLLGDKTKSIIGLWKWSLRQRYPQILTFNNGFINVLSTEIAAINEKEVHL